MDDLDSRDLLVLKSQPKDNLILGRFQNRWFDKLRAFGVKRGLTELDADELCGVWLGKLGQAAADYDPSREASPWLWKIYKNICIDHLRQKQAAPKHETLGDQRSKCKTPPELMEETEKSKAFAKICEQVLNELPLNERIIFSAYAIYGQDQRSWPEGVANDIERKTNISATSFSEYNRRASRKIQELRTKHQISQVTER